MLKNSKTPILIGVTIPLFGYLSWLLFFSHHFPQLAATNDKNNMFYFVLQTSAVAAVLSVIAHVCYSVFYSMKLTQAVQEIHRLNERIQGLTEDMAEVANYHHDQLSFVMDQIKAVAPKVTNPHPTLTLLNEAAEEISLRVDKTAIEVQRLDRRIKNFFSEERSPQKQPSSTTRKWESAYFYK